MKYAKLPNGLRLAFDDGTPDAKIDETVRDLIAKLKKAAEPAPAPLQIEPPVVNVQANDFSTLDRVASELSANMGRITTATLALIEIAKQLQETNQNLSIQMASYERANTAALTRNASEISSAMNQLTKTIQRPRKIEMDSYGNSARMVLE